MTGTPPACAACAHIDNGSCVRPIGRHFDGAFNAWRSRLHVSAALERSRRRTLTGRATCGPDGLFFEPKGSHDPLVSMENAVMTEAQVRDTIADSDGDDGA